MRGLRSWLLPVVAIVACLFLFAATARAQVFKPRTGSAAKPAPVKTASAAPTAAAPAKKPAAVASAPAAAKKPARPHRGKKAKKAADDEDTVVVDDGDSDDIKVTDD